MIKLLARDTCKTAYIPDEFIENMEEFVEETPERAYPYTRIYIKNPNDGYEYFIDVVESANKINRLIEEQKANKK